MRSQLDEVLFAQAAHQDLMGDVRTMLGSFPAWQNSVENLHTWVRQWTPRLEEEIQQGQRQEAFLRSLETTVMNLQEAFKALQVRASSSSSTTVQALPEGLTSLPGRVAQVESSLPRMQEEVRALADLCRSSPPGTSSTSLMQRLDEVQDTVLSLVESMHVLEDMLSTVGKKPEQMTRVLNEISSENFHVKFQ